VCAPDQVPMEYSQNSTRLAHLGGAIGDAEMPAAERPGEEYRVPTLSHSCQRYPHYG
jgi:hypothetical protein